MFQCVKIRVVAGPASGSRSHSGTSAFPTSAAVDQIRRQNFEIRERILYQFGNRVVFMRRRAIGVSAATTVSGLQVCMQAHGLLLLQWALRPLRAFPVLLLPVSVRPDSAGELTTACAAWAASRPYSSVAISLINATPMRSCLLSAAEVSADSTRLLAILGMPPLNACNTFAVPGSNSLSNSLPARRKQCLK